jgi:hypothetical protein
MRTRELDGTQIGSSSTWGPELVVDQARCQVEGTADITRQIEASARQLTS